MINNELAKDEVLIGELLVDMYGNYGKYILFIFIFSFAKSTANRNKWKFSEIDKSNLQIP